MLNLMELSITEKLKINFLCGEVLHNSDPATNYKTPQFFQFFSAKFTKSGMSSLNFHFLHYHI